MITQRLILDGGTWTCIGCHSALTEGIVQHPHDCPEMRPNTPGPLPSLPQVCAWLRDHGWAPVPPGKAGTLWCPPGRSVGSAVAVPHDPASATGAIVLGGALERIAKRSGLPFGDVLAGMRALSENGGDVSATPGREC